MTTTRVVVNEAPRLHPPAWAIQQSPIRDDRIRGYRVPAGATILLSPYVTHRHPKFRENPAGFNPARFTPERVRARQKYAYFPFGGGPRLCNDNNFANNGGVSVSGHDLPALPHRSRARASGRARTRAYSARQEWTAGPTGPLLRGKMRVVPTVILIINGVFMPATASAQFRRLTEQEQGQYAQIVRRGTRAEQAAVVNRLYLGGARQSGTVLRSALIEALEREVAYVEAQRGKNEQRDYPNMLDRLSSIVASFGDTRAIPALARAATSSLSAASGLAEFGEPAVSPLLETIERQPNVTLAWVPMVAFRFLVEGAGSAPLSAHSRDKIRDVARRYLNAPSGNASALTAAIDLAIALNDLELRALVERIAADRSEVEARGFANPHDIASIQKHAAERLAGKPATPKHRSRTL